MGQTQQTENSDEIDVGTLQDMYKKFVTECPSGQLFLHEFKRFFGVDPTGEAAEYAERMFRAFDKNGVRDQSCVGSAGQVGTRTHCLLSIILRTTPSTSWSSWRR